MTGSFWRRLGGWRAWRQLWRWNAWLGSGASQKSGWIGATLAVLVWACVGFVSLHSSFENSDGRAWIAFSQHYAVRAAMTGEATGINPWLAYPKLIEKAFPGANSLKAAWAANPHAMAHHITFNLQHAFGEIAGLFQIHIGLLAAALILIAGVCTALAAARGDSVKGRVPISTSVIIAVAQIIVIAPGLLVFAKGVYLLPLIPLVIGLVGWLWFQSTRTIPPKIYRIGTWVSGALVTIALATAWFSPRLFVPGSRQRPSAETAMAIRKAWPAAGRHVQLGVSSSSYAHYVGDDRCEGIEAIVWRYGVPQGKSTADVLATEYKPFAVLVTNDWRSSSTFNAAASEKTFGGTGWVVRDLPAGRFYMRADKL